jgi:hypothetical protein
MDATSQEITMSNVKMFPKLKQSSTIQDKLQDLIDIANNTPELMDTIIITYCGEDNPIETIYHSNDKEMTTYGLMGLLEMAKFDIVDSHYHGD